MSDERLSAKGKKLQSVDELLDSGEAGDWFVDVEKGDVWIVLPTISIYNEVALNPSRWPYKTPLENGACWNFNGDVDSPTLAPSLNWVGMWHGFLTNGELKHV